MTKNAKATNSPRNHYGRATADHAAQDTVRVNGRPVIHNGDAWVWAGTDAELDFDQCERFGLDGTGRRY